MPSSFLSKPHATAAEARKARIILHLVLPLFIYFFNVVLISIVVSTMSSTETPTKPLPRIFTIITAALNFAFLVLAAILLGAIQICKDNLAVVGTEDPERGSPQQFAASTPMTEHVNQTLPLETGLDGTETVATDPDEQPASPSVRNQRDHVPAATPDMATKYVRNVPGWP